MTKYQISEDNNVFRSLRAAKHHVFIAYPQEERMNQLNNTDIIRFENDVAGTRTRIYVTTDGYSFGKTIKI